MLAFVVTRPLPQSFARTVRTPARMRTLSITIPVILIALALLEIFVLSKSHFHAHMSDLVLGATLLTVLGWGAFIWTHRLPTGASEQEREPRRVLVISAHPDDLELACGGTVAKLVDGGAQVRALVMSRGSEGGRADVRENEARAGATFLGLASLAVHHFTDTNLAAHAKDMVQVIEQELLSFVPHLILTHSAHDQHQDHEAVHRAVLRAARKFPSILCFESPSVTRDFNPSVFVDISDHIDVKVKAVRIHMGQMSKPYMSDQRVRGIAAFRGSQAKTQFAEGFEPVRVLSSLLAPL